MKRSKVMAWSSLLAGVVLVIAQGAAEAGPRGPVGPGGGRGAGPGRGNGNGHAGVGFVPGVPGPGAPPPGHGGPNPGNGNGHGRPVVPPGHPGVPRRLVTPPARGGDIAEVDAADIVARAAMGLSCDQAAEAVRRLSNELLASVSFAADPSPYTPPPQAIPPHMNRGQFKKRIREHLRSAEFMQKVWDRMADMYRSCDRVCFDDGIAVGQISGSGYCAASVGLDGMTSPGFKLQTPLPVCETATFVGCQEGYRQAVDQFAGCRPYTEGAFAQTFRESQSVDCHMD